MEQRMKRFCRFGVLGNVNRSYRLQPIYKRRKLEWLAYRNRWYCWNLERNYYRFPQQQFRLNGSKKSWIILCKFCRKRPKKISSGIAQRTWLGEWSGRYLRGCFGFCKNFCGWNQSWTDCQCFAKCRLYRSCGRPDHPRCNSGTKGIEEWLARCYRYPQKRLGRWLGRFKVEGSFSASKSWISIPRIFWVLKRLLRPWKIGRQL